MEEACRLYLVFRLDHAIGLFARLRILVGEGVYLLDFPAVAAGGETVTIVVLVASGFLGRAFTLLLRFFALFGEEGLLTAYKGVLAGFRHLH